MQRPTESTEIPRRVPRLAAEIVRDCVTERTVLHPIADRRLQGVRGEVRRPASPGGRERDRPHTGVGDGTAIRRVPTTRVTPQGVTAEVLFDVSLSIEERGEGRP